MRLVPHHHQMNLAGASVSITSSRLRLREERDPNEPRPGTEERWEALVQVTVLTARH
ncbi:hypothetical protein BH23CHL2_BH23CHL2_18960 [soil metagenome]